MKRSRDIKKGIPWADESCWIDATLMALFFNPSSVIQEKILSIEPHKLRNLVEYNFAKRDLQMTDRYENCNYENLQKYMLNVFEYIQNRSNLCPVNKRINLCFPEKNIDGKTTGSMDWMLILLKQVYDIYYINLMHENDVIKFLQSNTEEDISGEYPHTTINAQEDLIIVFNQTKNKRTVIEKSFNVLGNQYQLHALLYQPFKDHMGAYLRDSNDEWYHYSFSELGEANWSYIKNINISEIIYFYVKAEEEDSIEEASRIYEEALSRQRSERIIEETAYQDVLAEQIRKRERQDEILRDQRDPLRNKCEPEDDKSYCQIMGGMKTYWKPTDIGDALQGMTYNPLGIDWKAVRFTVYNYGIYIKRKNVPDKVSFYVDYPKRVPKSGRVFKLKEPMMYSGMEWYKISRKRSKSRRHNSGERINLRKSRRTRRKSRRRTRRKSRRRTRRTRSRR